jgi:apolipoprotein N-acyltransferase
LATATDRPSSPPGNRGTEPTGPAAPVRPRVGSTRAAIALALLAGGLIALAMPPYGWWPLVFVGIAVWDRLLAGASWRQRLGRSYLVGVVWYVPTITWSWDLSPPGYVLAVIVMSAYVAAAALCTPPDRYRRLVLPGAVVIAQYLIGIYPWGGVPVAHLALTQAGSCAPPCTQVDSPLINAARIGGPLLVIALVVIAGQALGALADVVTARVRRHERPDPADVRAVAIGLGLVIVTTLAGMVAPRGHDLGPLHLAVVQGGGQSHAPPGNADAAEVFQRHVDATRRLVRTPVDIVLWPENIVTSVGPFEGSLYQE